MHIRLKNFRCYTDKTFDLGEEGLTLLSGPSGSGKSSVIMGIYFALFGVGTKVTSQGSTSCMVELEFDGLKIVRTKRPNRLVVNEVYEDASAQSIIDEKFGSTFNVTGYISQNALNSFVLMSPLDKLGFLEKFAFKDINLPEIKARCKALISKTNEELISVNSQLDMANGILGEMTEPEKVDFPIKCKKSQRELAIKNQGIKLKNTHTKIKKASKLIQNKEGEILNNKKLKEAIDYDQEMIDSVSNKIEKLSDAKSDIDYQGDEILQKYKSNLSSLLVQKELTETQKNLQAEEEKIKNMHDSELNKLKNRLEKITVWQEFSKSEIKEIIKSNNEALGDMKTLFRLRKISCDTTREELTQKEEDLELCKNSLENKTRIYEICSEMYTCPSCDEKLCIREGCLKSIEIIEDDLDTGQLEDDIDTLTSKVKKLERFINSNRPKLERKEEAEKEITEILESYEEEIDPDEIEKTIEESKSYIQEQSRLETEQVTLKRMIRDEDFFSDSYTLQLSSVKKLREKFNTLSQEKGIELEYVDEEELREKIQEQKEAKNSLKRIQKNITELEEEKTKYEEHILKIKTKYSDKYDSELSIEELEKDIKNEKLKISQLENDLEKIEENNQKLEQWKKYKEQEDKYEEWKNKVENLRIEEKEKRQRYASATTLKEKIMEAESIAVHNVISTINSHAQIYLDIFFPDNPILVRLSPFKKTNKTTKPQINVEIEYKGMEADLTMLSGGELSRVILAYTLALGEMFNTPLLMLDECTASLDQDLTGVVFEGIKENFNGKLVLIVAHQVITGTFDQKIQL